MNQAPLAAAVAIFTDLGWKDAAAQDAPTLPLGSEEQQRIAKQGLSTGAWGEYGKIGKNTYGWIDHTHVDAGLLALYALRLGVPARRFIQLQMHLHNVDRKLLAQLIAARGTSFATAITQTEGYIFQKIAELLVSPLQLPIPTGESYLHQWARSFADHQNQQVDPNQEPRWPTDRVVEHLELCLEHHVSPAEVASAITVAVRDGWVDRATAIEWIIAALDAAARPKDRSVWAKSLVEGLGLTTEEACANASHFIGPLSHAEGGVVELLIPHLMELTDEDLLGEALLLALQTPSGKAATAVLKRAAQRPHPSQELVELLEPMITDLATSPRAPVARAAQKLAAAWSIELVTDVPEQPMRGVWQATPPLWEQPRFEALDPTPENVTHAAIALAQRNDWGCHDLAVEQFLAAANALAYRDDAAARAALQGLATGFTTGLGCLNAWLEPNKGYETWLDHGVNDAGKVFLRSFKQPAEAREAVVFRELGRQPVLLSTPTWVDLRIDPSDLVQRLKEYQAAEAPVQEADLFLALLRTDVSLATDGIHAELAALTIPVLEQLGTAMSDTAGPIVSAYLKDPLRDTPSTQALPASLAKVFPPRFVPNSRHRQTTLDEHPFGANTLNPSLPYQEEYHLGVVLRQIARNATPLSPGITMKLIAAARPAHPHAQEACLLAIQEAWQRGLIIPGVADITLLNEAAPPTGLATLATALGELADDGLLSVVWPVLHDVVHLSATAPKQLAGTSDVVRLMAELLPAVQGAVAQGIAPEEALALPGVRLLAAKKSTSETVKAARALVAQLPAAPTPVAEATLVPFEDAWIDAPPETAAITDGMTITATWQTTRQNDQTLTLELIDPRHPERVFHLNPLSYYHALQNNRWVETWGNTTIHGSSEEPVSGLHTLWWDADHATLRIACTIYSLESRRGTRKILTAAGASGAQDPRKATRWSTSMVALHLAAACQQDPSPFPLDPTQLTERFGSAEVRDAVRALVGQPAIEPGRLMRILEKAEKPLSLYWPLLTELVRYAATLTERPRWINRVLDQALYHSSALREAAARGLIPAEAATWPGLVELTQGKKSAATTKAQQLLQQLGLSH